MARTCLLALLVALLPGSLSQEFRDHPASATVLSNFPTTISCSAPDPSPPFNIVWTFNDILTSSGATVDITYDSNTGISQYQINPVSYFDDGSYQCFAVDVLGGIVSESNVAILTVRGIPAFATPISPVTAPIGGQAVFECRVLSNPPADSIVWSFHDVSGTTRQLNFTSSGRVIVTQSSVTITSIVAEDEGFYDCTAENSFGRNTTSGRLFIGDPPPPLVLTITPSAPGPIIINETNSLVLTCGISDNDQVTSIQWLRGMTPLTAGISQSPNALSLAITSAVFGDGGVYTCLAVSSTGSNLTASISVIVQVSPVITEAPEDIITMENQPLPEVPVCLATGEPRPSIVWLHPDGSQVPVLGTDPQFGVITRSDMGVYVCAASNSAGTTTAEFTITVQGVPVFVVAPTDIEASFGQDVLVTCISDGLPEPAIIWSRLAPGTLLPENSLTTETELHLFSVTPETSGVYVCTAENDLGEIRREFSVTVLDPPQIVSATDEVAVLEGEGFVLDCVTSGPPSSVLTWHLNGSLLVPSTDPRLSVFPNGSLAVSSPTVGYSGVYTCNISTSFTSVTALITVLIGVVPGIIVAPQDSDRTPGEDVFLHCLSSGTPPPRTSWARTDPLGVRTNLSVVGQNFAVHSTGLELRAVSRVDSGTYDCVAVNTFGSVTQSATLRVEGAPLATGILPAEVVAGDNVTVSCDVLYDFPATTTAWRRASGAPLPTERFTVLGDGTLSISPVMEADQEVYSCTASNVYGSSEANATLTVNVRPAITLSSNQVTAVLADRIVLSCPTTGRPVPSIQWTLQDGRDAPASQSRYFLNGLSELVINNVQQSDGMLFTCTASNVVGSVSADVDVEVRGAAVSSLTALVLGTSLMQISWTPPPPALAGSLLSFELQFGATRETDRLTLVFGQTETQYIALGLTPGTEYEIVMTGRYSNNIRGIETRVLATTVEIPPTGPPLNIALTPLEEALRINWTLPAPDQQNGVITCYNVFYRVSPREPNATIAAMFPFTLVEYLRDEVEEVEHNLTIEGLVGREVYEVKIQACNSAGFGPNSTVINATVLPPREFTEFPFQLAQTLIIAILATLIGIALVVIAVMSISLLSYCCWKRVKREGKHKPLVEEKEFDRQQRRTSGKNKEKRVVSGPIPGITPHIDSSVEGKFSVQSKDGSVIPLNTKVITEADVAPPPVPGENVQKVPRKEILKSQDDNDFYTVPSDTLGEGRQSELATQVRTGGEGVKTNANRGSGIYSEPSTMSKPAVQGETDITPYAEIKRVPATSDGGEGGEGVRQAAGSKGVEQSPSHDASHDTTRDDQQLIYASISSEHVAKKREKKLKEQQKKDLKAENEQRRMQQKMERETKKQEARARKEAEKEAKRRAKEEEKRQSLGLSNVVRMHEVDFGSKEGRAQAQFIDAATAAIF